MRRRRGFTLLEITTAGILLAVMLVVCVQMFRATAAQRQALRDRRIAIREADNVMERLCARAWEELTPKSVRDLPVGEELRQALPGSELEIQLVRPDDEPNAKRITVVLRWPARSGRPDHSIRLVAWRYRQSED